MRPRGMRTLLLPTLLATLTLVPTAARAEDGPSTPAMRRANEAAATLVKERLRRENPDAARALAWVGQHDLVVVRGEYDHVESILRALGLRFLLVSPGQVKHLDLTAKQLVIVNCPGTIDGGGRERLARFVRAGGVLYTTDWALKNVVQRAFPHTIAWNGVSTTDDVVGVQVARNDDPMMKNFVVGGTRPRWWLEGSSYPIKILDSQRVEVLVSSQQMRSKYGTSPIAVTFPVEDGRVFHVVSHFYLQRNQGGRAVAAKKVLDGVQVSAPAKAALEKQMAGLSADDVGAAYAMQQMTANLVLGKQRQNVELDRVYGQKAKRAVALEEERAQGRGAGQKAARPAPSVAAGAQLKVLERKAGKAKVRDLRGNEGWVPADAI